MCPYVSNSEEVNILIEIISPLSTLLAAFFGAWFAFLLQNIKEGKKEKDDDVSTLNKAQINLVQQLNNLLILNKDFIKPYKDLPINWIAIPAVPPRNFKHLHIDGGSLAFLVDHGSASLISKILVAEEMFQEVMNVFNLRSEVHVSRLQPGLEKIGFIEGQPFDKSIEEVELLLGDRLVSEMKRLSTDLIFNVERTIKEHEELIAEIKEKGKQIFPKHLILSFEHKK